MTLRRFLFAALALAGCSGPDPTPAVREIPVQPRNVLVIVLDTVRDDRIGVRDITPNLDVFAEHSIVFENAYSNSGWTLPAHASMFTGLYPVRHRATQETLAFGIDLPTIAEILADRGWQTYGASANSVVCEANGLARGFGRFDETFRDSVIEEFGQEVHVNEGALLDFLDKNGDQPWFGFLNFIEAHLPYRPPAEFMDLFVDTERFSEELIKIGQVARMPDQYTGEGSLPADLFTLLGQLYDAEVATVDAHIGHLLQTLQDRGVLKNTVVVVTSDHGENLGENDHFAHVFDLQNTLVAVPLMIYIPGMPGSVRTDPAQLLDLFPTLLTLNGIKFEGETHGRDLFGPGAARENPVVVAEYYYPRVALSVIDAEDLETWAHRFEPFLIRQRVAQTLDRKWWWRSNGRYTAIDLVKDPREMAGNEVTKAPRSHRDLAKLLESFVATYQGNVPLVEAPPPGWMMPGFEATIDDPELLERLRALGYVN
jgi:arylsulfatase A-like enzyme